MAGLHDLVEVADRARLHGTGQRTVSPHDVATGHHEAAHEIGTCEVVVTTDRDHGPLKQIPHVLDEPRLPTTGRSREHHRYEATIGLFEELGLVAVGVIGRAAHS